MSRRDTNPGRQRRNHASAWRQCSTLDQASQPPRAPRVLFQARVPHQAVDTRNTSAADLNTWPCRGSRWLSPDCLSPAAPRQAVRAACRVGSRRWRGPGPTVHWRDRRSPVAARSPALDALPRAPPTGTVDETVNAVASGSSNVGNLYRFDPMSNQSEHAL